MSAIHRLLNWARERTLAGWIAYLTVAAILAAIGAKIGLAAWHWALR